MTPPMVTEYSTALDNIENQPGLIEVENLNVKFESQHVLRDISLSIPHGQTLVIIGESGCGKTVLMKSIVGLIKPTSGRVLFDSLDVNRLSQDELSCQRVRLGFVFQNAALFDSMTIGQNIAFPLRQHTDYTKAQVEELVFSRLSDVGLPQSVVFKKPAELSGGMRKRVGLARALIMNPELLVYDEPTTGLDPIMSDVINELIIRTRRQNPVTSIIVTHDMSTAKKVPERVIMVYPISRLDPDEPQIIYDGPPDEMDSCRDRRVRQFVNGEAGERLMEMRFEEGGGA